MVRAEAEYKAKYVSILRDPGDIDLIPELVKEFCAKHAPQIEAPSRFVVCKDYAEFAEKVKGDSDHPVNAANIVNAIHSAYFSPPLRHADVNWTHPGTGVFSISSGAVWSGPPQDRYEMLDVQLSFDEPTQISTLIAGRDAGKGVRTFHWLSGLAFDEMRKDYFNVAPVEFHKVLCDLARNCFAFWQKDKDFVICAKPSVSLDFRYRLHHDTRKAIQFPSGDGFHALRGVRVDERYITEPVSGKELMKERNAEVRMVLLEKYGAKLLDDVPHKVVSKKGDGRLFGLEPPHTRLIEMSWDGYEKIRMLHLKWKDKEGQKHETLLHVPATQREFEGLGSKPPKDVDDCEQMRRWVMRLNPEDVLVEET